MKTNIIKPPLVFIGITDTSENKEPLCDGDIVKVWDDCGEDEATIHEIRYFGHEDWPAYSLYPLVECDCNPISYYKIVGNIVKIGNKYEKSDQFGENVMDKIEKKDCKKIDFGTYEHSENFEVNGKEIFCDYCLKDEIVYLNLKGVKTVASCCGHGKQGANIAVSDKESVKIMQRLGYEKYFNPMYPNSDEFFKAKSELGLKSDRC